MKAFKIKEKRDYDIVAAPNIIKAVIFYHNETGLEIEDFNNDGTIEEIPKSEWKNIKIDSERVINPNSKKSLYDLMKIVVNDECEMIATSNY